MGEPATSNGITTIPEEQVRRFPTFTTHATLLACLGFDDWVIGEDAKTNADLASNEQTEPLIGPVS